MKINFWLNGAKKEAEISPDIMLLEFLRSLGCYSVKRGCETANCGLCTVLVNDKPMLSCSVLAARIDGKKVTTMEGLQAEAEEFGTFLANEGAEQRQRLPARYSLISSSKPWLLQCKKRL